MFNFAFGGGGDDDDDDGPPHHSHGRRRGGGGRGGGPVDNNKYYELLGLEKSATPNDVKKAFRKLAMTHHPDKGGDQEKFKEISTAYEVLMDPEKKELYDTYGEEGLRDGGPPGGGGPADLFEAMFGGGGGGGRRGRGGASSKRKGEDVVFPLKVTLEEMYAGSSKKLRVVKNVVCTGCAGKGGVGNAVKTCAACKGAGVRVMLRQIGPGMVQQMQTACGECNGEGTIIPEANRCAGCKGAKTTKEKKMLEVFVNKGMRHGERIVFKGEADEAPDTVPGDIVVVLQQKDHDVFRREGPHLFMKHSITLAEALTGFQFTVRHLDGRVLRVKSEPSVVYKPGDVMAVKDEGMPLAKNPYSNGSLFVEFNVEFPKPEELADNVKKLLRKMLPLSEEKALPEGAQPDDVHDVALSQVDVDEERRKFAEQGREAYEDDTDEAHHSHGPGCRTA